MNCDCVEWEQGEPEDYEAVRRSRFQRDVSVDRCSELLDMLSQAAASPTVRRTRRRREES